MNSKNYVYEKWTMKIDGTEYIIYDGKEFKNFEELHKVCGSRYLGKNKYGMDMYDDSDLFININDDVMDGITEGNPAGKWNTDHTCWSWGLFINDNYVEFFFYPSDKENYYVTCLCESELGTFRDDYIGEYIEEESSEDAIDRAIHKIIASLSKQDYVGNIGHDYGNDSIIVYDKQGKVIEKYFDFKVEKMQGDRVS